MIAHDQARYRQRRAPEPSEGGIGWSGRDGMARRGRLSSPPSSSGVVRNLERKVSLHMSEKKGRGILYTVLVVLQLVLALLTDEHKSGLWNAITSMFTAVGPTIGAALLTTMAVAVWDQLFDFKGLPRRVRSKLYPAIEGTGPGSLSAEQARRADLWTSKRELHRWLAFQSRIVRLLVNQSIVNSGQRPSNVTKKDLVAKKKDVASRFIWEFERDHPRSVSADSRYDRATFFTWLKEQKLF